VPRHPSFLLRIKIILDIFYIRLSLSLSLSLYIYIFLSLTGEEGVHTLASKKHTLPSIKNARTLASIKTIRTQNIILWQSVNDRRIL
jgi:hypothetical protein